MTEDQQNRLVKVFGIGLVLFVIGVIGMIITTLTESHGIRLGFSLGATIGSFMVSMALLRGREIEQEDNE